MLVSDNIFNFFNVFFLPVKIILIETFFKADVSIALGDYDNAADLMQKIRETRRMKGKAFLGNALREAIGEFLISGTNRIPKVVLIFSNGKSR